MLRRTGPAGIELLSSLNNLTGFSLSIALFLSGLGEWEWSKRRFDELYFVINLTVSIMLTR